MTEEDARQRWCPFARIADTVHTRDAIFAVALNRYDVRDLPDNPTRWPTAARCIASDCMAWRWTRTDPVSGIFPQNTTDGFCGLAGLP